MRKAVETRAVGDCFHSCFEFSQNFYECYHNFMETRKESLYFFYKMTAQKISSLFPNNSAKWPSTNQHAARSILFIL